MVQISVRDRVDKGRSAAGIIFFFYLNQQSEYEISYKLMCWPVINGMQEIHPVIYLICMFSHN
jgi:hypothetical protein